jgi:FixJ family two-component response regulator
MLDFFKSALPGFRLKFYPSAAALLRSPPSKGLAVIDSSLPDMSGRDLVSVLRGDKKTSGLLLVLTGCSRVRVAPGTPPGNRRSIVLARLLFLPKPGRRRSVLPG